MMPPRRGGLTKIVDDGARGDIGGPARIERMPFVVLHPFLRRRNIKWVRWIPYERGGGGGRAFEACSLARSLLFFFFLVFVHSFRVRITTRPST